MMTVLFSLCLGLLSSSAQAISLVVTEGARTSKNTIFIDTINARVDIATQSYNGGIPNVGLYTSSNVVISSSSVNSCVIYATGSIVCKQYSFGDGTTQTTSASAYLINFSSQTGINTAFNTSATTTGIGVTGSTLTFTTGAKAIACSAAFYSQCNTNATQLRGTLFIDSSPWPGYTASTAMTTTFCGTSGQDYFITIPFTVSNTLTAGSHSVYMSVSVDANTANVNPSTRQASSITCQEQK